MDVLEWWCALSVALDREEDIRRQSFYEAYIAGQYDPKKLPKKAPQRYTIPDPDAAPTGQRVNVLDQLARARFPVTKATGNIEEYARIRGWRKVFQLEDGTFVDEDGNPTLPPPGSVFVPVKKAD